MSKRPHFQLELSGSTATLYVLGAVDAAAVAHLVDVCRELPTSVRTLRLDMSALGSMSAEALELPRRLLWLWKATRVGEFRLSTSYLVATVSESASTPRPWSSHREKPIGERYDLPRNDALMAAFL